MLLHIPGAMPYAVAPPSLGQQLMQYATALDAQGQKVPPATLLYCEKRGGFQCRTCKYAVAVNATHGTCRIMDGTIHLDEGCCALWTADPVQLHLYREPIPTP